MGKVQSSPPPPPPPPSSSPVNMTTKLKKKKGRPPKNSYSAPLTNRRSVRPNPNSPEFDDDDDDRTEKKVKLLPQSDDNDNNTPIQLLNNKRHSPDEHSEDGDDDDDAAAKRLKITNGSDGIQEQGGEGVRVTDTNSQHESPLGSGPTTPLPDKKLLVFILDRLQKKDTYRVFSEPVDPDELPDYFEIIQQPMDFGTVRNKLETGTYQNLDELEADVLLICSNAMQYNAPHTVYYRQARNIQDLARRDFDNLRHEGDDGEPQPKVVRRGRPPGQKSQKKPLEVPPVASEVSPVVTLGTGEERGTGSYNLRKAPAVNRHRFTDPYMSSYRWKNGENYSESADWNTEFPASILRADMKQGKKNFIVDENRRDTYREFHPLAMNNNSSSSSNGIGNEKRLIPVGAQEPLAYARSLARFAATLGPLAWKIASRKIEASIPPGTPYGPGWVGDNGTQSQPLSFSSDMGRSSNSSLQTPSTSDPSSAIGHQWASEGMVEAVRKINNQNEVGVQGEGPSWRVAPFQLQQQQKAAYPVGGRNGFSGYELSSSGALGPDNGMSLGGAVVNPVAGAQMWNFGKSGWPVMPMQRNLVAVSSVQGEGNIRVPAAAGGSPGTSSVQQIGSGQQQQQQQPDLALQL